MQLNKVIISGGGTGGHIFPAIAIANEIRKRNPAAEILFVGARGKMEMEKVPEAGYRIEGLPISGIQRRFTLRNLLVPFKLLKSVMMARKIISDFKPDAVVGVGGYASSALVYAASLKNVPVLIQEQNSYAGLTNKWLGKKAKVICVAYDGMQRFFPAERIVITGNPVRSEIYMALNSDKKEMKLKLGFDPDKPLLLVIGGSLGARTINRSMQRSVKALSESDIQVLWQTGKSFEAEIGGLRNVKASRFIQDMCTAYAAADYVVSRAGAISVSELCLLRKPCILVPSPNVAEDHQTKNALALSSKDAAILVRDNEAETKLLSEILNLNKDKALQQKLSENISEFARPDALKHIVDELEKLKL